MWLSGGTCLALEDAVELNHGVPQGSEAEKFVCIIFELQEEHVIILLRTKQIRNSQMGMRN